MLLIFKSPVNYQSVEETKQAVTLCLRDFFRYNPSLSIVSQVFNSIEPLVLLQQAPTICQVSTTP